MMKTTMMMRMKMKTMMTERTMKMIRTKLKLHQPNKPRLISPLNKTVWPTASQQRMNKNKRIQIRNR